MLPLVRMFSYCLLAVVLLCPAILALSMPVPNSRWRRTRSGRSRHMQGVSWLLTPCGERFLSIGVNALDGGYPSRIFEGRLAYHWGTFYPTSKPG